MHASEYLDPLEISGAAEYLDPLEFSSACEYLGPMPRDPSYSELCSEALLGSSIQTRRELFTLQIWEVGKSSRAGSIRTCNLESTAVKMVTQTDFFY